MRACSMNPPRTFGEQKNLTNADLTATSTESMSFPYITPDRLEPVTVSDMDTDRNNPVD